MLWCHQFYFYCNSHKAAAHLLLFDLLCFCRAKHASKATYKINKILNFNFDCHIDSNITLQKLKF